MTGCHFGRCPLAPWALSTLLYLRVRGIFFIYCFVSRRRYNTGVVLLYGAATASLSVPLKIAIENFVGYGLQKSDFDFSSQQKIDQLVR